MYKKLVPVNRERHAQTRLHQSQDFAFAHDAHVAYLTLPEFSQAAPRYPIVFVKREDGFSPMALLGLEPDKNLFVDPDGRWNAHYIPATVRRYPFALAAASATGEFTVCIDEDSPWVSTSEGLPLFDAHGQPTAVIDNVKRFLAELQQMDLATKQFANWLQSHDMLTPMTLSVRDQDAMRHISGCYLVNEDRLNGLPDTLLVELRNRHYLHAIYAHLLSLTQVERLADLGAIRRANRSPQESPDDQRLPSLGT